MGTKAVVGSFLNINIWKNPFAGMSSLFSKSDSKGIDKKGNTEEKKVEEIDVEPAGEHIALSEKASEVVEQTIAPTVTETVQEEVVPAIITQPTVEVQSPKPLEVQSQRETTVQQRATRSARSVQSRPVEKARYYGGGSGYSQRRGSNSSGNGGWCVTPSGSRFIDDVKRCFN